MGEVINAYKTSAEKLKRMIQLGRPRHSGEDNIKKIYLKEIQCLESPVSG
jgi:hypothetical protein